jgi:hypothetical protein
MFPFQKTPLLLFIASATVLTASAGDFGSDEAFLRQHTEIISLSSSDGQSKVLIAPQWQGRVMTSTLAGDAGFSFGWINYDLIPGGIAPEAERTGLEKHIYVFGGAERFWLGPEGGQYSLYFAPDAPDYQFEYWKTPALIDTEAYDVVKTAEPKWKRRLSPRRRTLKHRTSVSFVKQASLTNKAGFTFDLKIDRTVSLLNLRQIERIIETKLSASTRAVAFSSENRVTNIGSDDWQADTGLPSIWLLGMLKHSPKSVVGIPVREAAGEAVRSDYFGRVDRDRLTQQGQTVFFKADGQYRSKIGIPPSHATPFAGSYDDFSKVLTIVHYTLPSDAANQPYVKSQWEDHEAPYAGDVINAYNDGAPTPDSKPLGPFYELESSSPALALRQGQSYTHTQTTIHLQGPEAVLNSIAEAILGASLNQFRSVFK